MYRVYCVEDEVNICELISYTLNSVGFETCGFGTGKELKSALSTTLPDIILLDIMLPDTDGVELLKWLKNTPEYKDIPVIFLTAKSSQIDKIKGLDSGADDYVTKPFDIMELVSRINAVLRRAAKKDEDVIRHRDMIIDISARKITVEDMGEVVLTYKEFELLKILVLNKAKVMSRNMLLNKVWGVEFEGETRTVDVHIRTLRQKLGKQGEYIETVRNVGYKII